MGISSSNQRPVWTAGRFTLSVGAMVGARGCVLFVPDPDPVLAAAGSGVYQVSVVWQGNSKTAVPTVGCATGQYGDDAQRRAVTVPVKIAQTS